MSHFPVISIGDALEAAESLSIIAASIVTIAGVKAWRSEAKWKRKAEVAETVLLAFHRVESSFRQIRMPWMSNDERSRLLNYRGSTRSDITYAEEAMITLLRYEDNIAAFDELRSARLRFKVTFRGADESPFDDVEHLLAKMLSASSLLGKKYWPQQGREMSDEAEKIHLSKMEEYEKWHWASATDEDPLVQGLNDAKRKLEATCARYVS